MSTFEERVKARIAKRKALGLTADEMQEKEKADAKRLLERKRYLVNEILNASVVGNQHFADQLHEELKRLEGKTK